MLLVPPYKTTKEVIIELDTGGSFFHFFSRKNDGKLTYSELEQASRSSAATPIFIRHILSQFSEEEAEKLSQVIPAHVYEEATKGDGTPPSQSAKGFSRASILKVVSLEGNLRPHRVPEFKGRYVRPVSDAFQTNTESIANIEREHIRPLESVYQTALLHPDVVRDASTHEPILVLLEANGLVHVPSQPIRITGIWDGLFDEKEKSIQWWHMRALFYTPLDAQIDPLTNEDYALAGDLLRNSITHRIK